MRRLGAFLDQYHAKIFWIVWAMIVIVFLIVPKAHAATLQWDRNTEADMKEYEVYSCTPAPTCTVQQIPASRIGVVPQSAVGVIPSFLIPIGTEGKLAVSASDTAVPSNESGLSVPVPFDAKAPIVPVNPRVGP